MVDAASDTSRRALSAFGAERARHRDAIGERGVRARP